MSCRIRAVDTPKICAHSETESMDFPFESPDMNATTIQKPLRYRKGFRSRRALIAFNEHVGRLNKEQHATERKSARYLPPLNAQPVKRYERLTGWAGPRQVGHAGTKKAGRGCDRLSTIGSQQSRLAITTSDRGQHRGQQPESATRTNGQGHQPSSTETC